MIRAWTENFSDIIIKASIFAIDYFVKYLEFPMVSIMGCLNFLTMSESTLYVEICWQTNCCWKEIQYFVQFILMVSKVNVGIREIDYCCASP